MRTPSGVHGETPHRVVPAELSHLLAAVGALLAVLVGGAMIAAALPGPTTGIWFAAAFAAPAAIAFTVYWWVSQKL